jgi:hypothetical protein
MCSISERRKQNMTILTRFIYIGIVFMLIFSACASPQQESSEGGTTASSDLPDFFLNPPAADDVIYGVGLAKLSDVAGSRRLAIARAREDIAFQMNAQIQSAIVDYAQESGADGNTQVLNFVETVSRQVADTTLQTTRTERVEQGGDGTIYALVSYSVNQFSAAAAQAFQRNEDAAFAEFKADEALKYLDATLANNPSQAGQNQ